MPYRVPEPLFRAMPEYSTYLPLLMLILYRLTPKHSGDLEVATKEPRKGRPAAIGRELLRLVKWLWAHDLLEPLFD